jgi:hypothetical protein
MSESVRLYFRKTLISRGFGADPPYSFVTSKHCPATSLEGIGARERAQRKRKLTSTGKDLNTLRVSLKTGV